MPYSENAEFIRLFQAYTGSATSIGAHFGQAAGRAAAADPLIVATGFDIALYPGGGAPPTIEGYRLSNRGFKETAAISHLGPALATLVWLKEHGPDGVWRADAEELLAATRGTRAANSVALWQDEIAAPSFVGRAESIAAMVDYACRLTERFLERSLADDTYLTAARLRADYLEGPTEGLPVPFNRVMVATFFLTGMDLGHRLITWFDGLDLPWERAMVVIAGRQGRPTAGVTLDSNSVAGVILAASRGRLPTERLLIAPHAPVFPMHDGGSTEAVEAIEHDYRRLWSSMTAMSALGEPMFAGYPRFKAEARNLTELTPETRSVHQMPAVTGPTDWLALTTRLRVVLEDPRQLLSGAVTDYASAQLVQNANRPEAVTVPGLDGEPYPALRPDPLQSENPRSAQELTT